MRVAYSIVKYWFCTTTDKIMSGEMCQTWKYPGGSTEAQSTQSTYAFGLKQDIDPTYKDNFSRLVHNSGQMVLNTWWLWVLFSVQTKSYRGKLKVSSYVASKVLKRLRNSQRTFNFRQRSKVFGNSSEIFGSPGTFPKISVMTRWKSHAFDFEKVGRYNIWM